MPKTLTLQDHIANLDKEQREGLAVKIREAVEHLAICWDCLRDAEEFLAEASDDDSATIETDDIQVLAGETTLPQDIYLVKTDDLIEALGVR